MIYSLKKLMREALINYDQHDRKYWIINNPCQVMLTIEHVQFTRIYEDFLDGDGSEI